MPTRTNAVRPARTLRQVKLHIKAGKVTLNMSKLPQTFETAVIELYRRREDSVEESD
jgi:hypothetical protein